MDSIPGSWTERAMGGMYFASQPETQEWIRFQMHGGQGP